MKHEDLINEAEKIFLGSLKAPSTEDPNLEEGAVQIAAKALRSKPARALGRGIEAGGRGLRRVASSALSATGREGKRLARWGSGQIGKGYDATKQAVGGAIEKAAEDKPVVTPKALRKKKALPDRSVQDVDFEK